MGEEKCVKASDFHTFLQVIAPMRKTLSILINDYLYQMVLMIVLPVFYVSIFYGSITSIQAASV